MFGRYVSLLLFWWKLPFSILLSKSVFSSNNPDRDRVLCERADDRDALHDVHDAHGICHLKNLIVAGQLLCSTSAKLRRFGPQKLLLLLKPGSCGARLQEISVNDWKREKYVKNDEFDVKRCGKIFDEGKCLLMFLAKQIKHCFLCN